MDPALYEAAVKGDIDAFENYQTCLNQLMTPNKNTILHVYLENQNKEPEFTDFVDIILEMCPTLLLQANIKDETPLHFAARYGHSNLVNVLIDRAEALPMDPESGVTEAKKMLRMTNGEKDTALHVAARYIQSRVVEISIEKDPEFSSSANDYGETPLYIATNKQYRFFDGPEKREKAANRSKVIGEILRKCHSVVDYGGPNGRTALHAAIMIGDLETARKLLKEEKNLTKISDQNGWSPLHYAAFFSDDPGISIVELLLDYDVSAAYIVDTDRNRTALHIAAVKGNQKAMEKIAYCCPTCCELVDNRAWNALHYVVASKRLSVFKQSLEIPQLGRLKNEKDEKGNTPFHLIAALAHKQDDWDIFMVFGITQDEMMICGLNQQNLSVDDIYQGNFDEIQKEILESIEDVGSGPLGRFVVEEKERPHIDKGWKRKKLSEVTEPHLVVTALIATVTFAAAFTLPGGYKNEGPNQGTAILSKEAAFIVFVISDAMAMVLSTSAIFTHFFMAMLIFDDQLDESGKLLEWAGWLTMSAMVTMVIAFITGTYAVLKTSLGLAITTCFIGLSFFLYLYRLLKFIIKET